ncbi:apoptosis inhibitor 5-like [Aphomia sociella]
METFAALKGSDREKRFASKIIAAYFTNFPNLAEQGIEAQFHLCKDDNVAVRKEAISSLPYFSKHNKKHTHRIAEFLAQQLQSDVATEIQVVNKSLLTMLRNNPKATLAGLFPQIHQCTEVSNGVVRERCIKFLATNVKRLGREVIDNEAEDLIITECKNILKDVSDVEFEHVMEILTWTKLGKTLAGKKELVEIVAALSLSSDDWHPKDPLCINRIIQCCQHALYLFTVQMDSNQFVNFFCKHVLRSWNDIAPADDDDTDYKLELLKIFAEITEHCGEIENAQDTINTVCDLLMIYLPEAPVDQDSSSESESESEATEDTETVPSLQFFHVECALFALHSLCRRAPVAIVAGGARLRNLRERLYYTAKLTQGYVKKLMEVTQEEKLDDDNIEEYNLHTAELITTANIKTLMRDFFRIPPGFRSRVQLSFQRMRQTGKEVQLTFQKSEDSNEQSPPGQKRFRSISFDNEDVDEPSDKRPCDDDRNQNILYVPPWGAWLSKHCIACQRRAVDGYA